MYTWTIPLVSRLYHIKFLINVGFWMLYNTVWLDIFIQVMMKPTYDTICPFSQVTMELLCRVNHYWSLNAHNSISFYQVEWMRWWSFLGWWMNMDFCTNHLIFVCAMKFSRTLICLGLDSNLVMILSYFWTGSEQTMVRL